MSISEMQLHTILAESSFAIALVEIDGNDLAREMLLQPLAEVW